MNSGEKNGEEREENSTGNREVLSELFILSIVVAGFLLVVFYFLIGIPFMSLVINAL